MKNKLMLAISIICLLITNNLMLEGKDNEAAIKPDVPEWLHSAVFYQIYPQSFKDSDGDGIGDLEGAISKLDYLKDLGVNAMWFNPFYVSPFCDAGYDVADYYKVDPRYGTNETAKKLFDEAHKRDMKVIIDLVIGHTSIEHPWFEASVNREPKYENWYIWTDHTWPRPNPNKDYPGKFVQGYAERNGQFMINFYWCQPRLNYGFPKEEIKYDWQLPTNHPDVRALKDEMKKIMRFWLDMGADGFRVDMAHSAGKDFWLEVREMLDKEYPDRFLVSEWSDPVKAINAGFHGDYIHWQAPYFDLFHKKWINRTDTVYNFFEPEGKGNIAEFVDYFMEANSEVKDKGYMTLQVDNHDMIRAKSYGRDDTDLEIMYAFQMTFPCIPIFYYGDEIGMPQVEFENEETMEGAYETRAGDRTPMQWDNSKNYGFSTADKEELYLPQDRSPNSPTMADQKDDENSLLNQTKKLMQLRGSEKALQTYAEFTPLYAEPHKYPFIFSRSLEGENILVVLNPANRDISVNIGLDTTQELKKLIGKGINIKIENGFTNVTCKGRSYSIYKY